MLRTCCVPDCISNNRSTYYEGMCTLLFPFPRDDRRKAQWLLSIPKSDFQLYRGSAVCIKHFEDRFIIREDKVPLIDRSEVIVKANNIKLTDDAVPTIFNTRTKLPSKNVTKRRRESNMKNNEFEEFLSTKRSGSGHRTKILKTEVLKKRNYITCCAQACTNTSENHVLIRLPLDFERRQQWICRINRDDWTPSKYSALCQIHFEADVWEENAFGEKVLKDDFLPTLNLNGSLTFNKPTKIKDELISSITDDKTADQERENSLCIKEEALEPDIEMLEETPRVIQPFETVYLNSNMRKPNNNLIENTNMKFKEDNKLQVETIVHDILLLPESIKTEPMIIENNRSQTQSCSESNQDFKKKWELNCHLREKHSGNENTLRFINKQEIPLSKSTECYDPAVQMVALTSSLTNFTSATTCSSSTSTQVEGTPQNVSPLLSTCQSVSTIISPITLKGEENTTSNQHLDHLTQTLVNKLTTFPSEARSPPSSTPTTLLPLSTVDSSEAFFISLAEFPELQRVEIKREMLEVVEMWKKKRFALK